MTTSAAEAPDLYDDDASAGAGQTRALARDEREPDGAVGVLDRTGDDAEAALATSPPQPPLRRILIGVDLAVVAIGWAVAVAVAFSTGEVAFGAATAVAQGLVMLGVGGLILSAAGLYRRRVCAIRSVEVARTGRVSLAMAALAVVLLASVGLSAAVLSGVAGGVTWFVLLVMERGVLREWINGRRASGDFGAPVLVVGGSMTSTLETARFLSDNPVLGFRVSGVSCERPDDLDDLPFPWIAPSDDPLERVRRSGASGVVLDSSSMTGGDLNAVVQRLDGTGLHIHISSGLRGVDVRRISVSPLADEAFLHVMPSGLTRRQVAIKRVLDVVGATIALVLLFPVLLVMAVAVWAHDRGPMLFRQERVGQDGERFMLYKLRTMVRNAEQLRAELEAGNERSGPLFKLGHDPRVTPIGRFLRASSIDEIPQLFNVLEGTMSLVGPRPALPDEVAQFDDHLNTRLTVKPGVTGLWQVEARDLPSFDLYRRYDLLYVQNWSFGVDLAIIARTVAVVALRAGRSFVPSRRQASEMAP